MASTSTSRWIYFALLLGVIFVSGALGGHRRRHREHDDSRDSDEHDYHHDKHHDDDDDDDHHHHHGHHGWRWNASAGLGVLIVIVCVVCGLLSLVAWLSCKIYDKCRKNKVDAGKAAIRAGGLPPEWTNQLVFQPEMAIGFGLVSEGFTRLGSGHLVRHRKDCRTTDGASWAVPMTKGKHVFEITWTWGHRGSTAGVGVGTKDAPIKAKGLQALVGSNVQTWGLDIVGRKARHANKAVLACPTDGSYVPDKFLMYVDVDDGKLGFGNDVTYWGDVITDLPKGGSKPLYVMVGASRWQAEVSVLYKGSAMDGENTMSKEKPPHHLAPLYPRAPPVYTEVDAPIMVKPSLPHDTVDMPEEEPEEKPCSPPPPYAPAPVGYSKEANV